MIRTYRTPKGTELPLISLKGKEYLEVKYRLVWFREDHPDWSLETELILLNESDCHAKCVVKDATGRVIATAHKHENKNGFVDFSEKAETGSIGRALALCGYGTQFCAAELDEGPRIVDAPVATQVIYRPDGSGGRQLVSVPKEELTKTEAATEGMEPRSLNPGDYRIEFGQFKNKRLTELGLPDLQKYVNWLEDSAHETGKELSQNAVHLRAAVNIYAQALQKAEA